MIFDARLGDPGSHVWLRTDLAAMLNSLAIGRRPGDDFSDGYLAALVTVGTCLGIRVKLPPTPERRTEIEVVSVEPQTV